MPVQPLRPDYDLNDPTTLTLDLANPKPKDVILLQDAFNAAIRSNPDLGPLPVHEGWNDITPATAINLLLRNPPGLNRWLNGTKVFYYANQMANNDWKATGQPILVDTDEKLADAQHRLYGIVVSGATIKSYVITGIEPGLFAYIDNTSGRSAKDAMQTAGFNGVAGVIVNIVKFAEKVRLGKFNRSGASNIPPFSPADIVRVSRNYPNVGIAARSASSDWENVSELAYKRKDIVGYVGMRIIDEHDEDVANDFFEEIMQTEEGNCSEYAAAIHKEMEKDRRADNPMLRQHMAAMLIKVFNAWVRNETLGRRWMPTVTEDFPILVRPVPQAEAAE